MFIYSLDDTAVVCDQTDRSVADSYSFVRVLYRFG